MYISSGLPKRRVPRMSEALRVLWALWVLRDGRCCKEPIEG
jgi:hypothetical protein